MSGACYVAARAERQAPAESERWWRQLVRQRTMRLQM